MLKTGAMLGGARRPALSGDSECLAAVSGNISLHGERCKAYIHSIHCILEVSVCQPSMKSACGKRQDTYLPSTSVSGDRRSFIHNKTGKLRMYIGEYF